MPSTDANGHEAVDLVGAELQVVDAASAPVESAAVSTRAERLSASGHWLLAAAPLRPQAKTEWEERGAAWLRPGVLFTAVVIPAGILHAAVGMDGPEACAAPLAEVLEYGPLFYSPDDFRGDGAYTALLPARVGRLTPPLSGVVTHPPGALLLVPAPDATAPSRNGGPWWVSPLDGRGLLCPTQRVVALAAVGRDILTSSKGRPDA